MPAKHSGQQNIWPENTRYMKNTLISFLFYSFLSVNVGTPGLAFSKASFSATHNPSDAFLVPFQFQIDPMASLLLVNFEKDPDSLYLGFEPQVFDDPVNGKGMLVIGWRVDGWVDVYYQPGLRIYPVKYSIAGKGLANAIETELSKDLFDITENGVQAEILFYDLLGREVRIMIKESNPAKRKPFGLLAPMGDAAVNPSAMPLIYLHDFYFVRKKKTEIEVSVNSRIHKTEALPVPMDWQKMYFVRYSPDPFIVTFNPAGSGPLKPIATGGNLQIEKGNDAYEFARYDSIVGLKSMTARGLKHEVRLSFDPAFPDIKQLAKGDRHEGKFTIISDPATGTISGIYEVERTDAEVRIVMWPSAGWKPEINKFSLRFMYTVAQVFKKWPSTYRWEAIISPAADGDYLMQSEWIRLESAGRKK